MPRGRKLQVNPFAEGTEEYVGWERRKLDAEAMRERRKLDAEAMRERGERNITVQVSVEAIQAAKALGTIAGLPYRQVLGNAAQAGIVTLVKQVQDKLSHGEDEGAMPF